MPWPQVASEDAYRGRSGGTSPPKMGYMREKSSRICFASAMSSAWLSRVRISMVKDNLVVNTHLQMTACGSLGSTGRGLFSHRASASSRIFRLCWSCCLSCNDLDVVNGDGFRSSARRTALFRCTPSIPMGLSAGTRSMSTISQRTGFTRAGRFLVERRLLLGRIGTWRRAMESLREDTLRFVMRSTIWKD